MHIGICSYLLGQMKEVPQCFETAHAQYRDKRIHHCALRVALTYAEILKLRGDFKVQANTCSTLVGWVLIPPFPNVVPSTR